MHDPADLQVRRAEVEQKAQMVPGRPQVVEALRAMRAIKASDRLQFDKNGILNQEIDKVLAGVGRPCRQW